MAANIEFKKDSKLVFKTVSYFSYSQMPVAIIFLMGGIYVIYMALSTLNDGKQFNSKIFVIFITLFGLWSIIHTIFHWFVALFTVEIDGNQITGYNLFGKQSSFVIKDIIAIRKKFLMDEFWLSQKSAKNLMISPSADYYGFILDYILQRVNYNCKIESKALEKLRYKPAYWAYTRRMPFTTSYPKRYLEWLESIVEQQKEELIAKGVLRADYFYGEIDPHKKKKPEVDIREKTPELELVKQYYNKAVLAEIEDREAEAKEYYQKVLELNQSGTEYNIAKDRLESLMKII